LIPGLAGELFGAAPPPVLLVLLAAPFVGGAAAGCGTLELL
jgi:hypothetical protein